MHLKITGAKKCYRNPTVWGPPTWFFLHSMTLALDDEVPVEQQETIKAAAQNRVVRANVWVTFNGFKDSQVLPGRSKIALGSFSL